MTKYASAAILLLDKDSPRRNVDNGPTRQIAEFQKRETTMAEVNAVIGYLPDAAAKALASGKYAEGPVEVRLEPGNDDVHVRIDPRDIAGVLLGASKKGESGVQVFLNDKAKVETVARGLAEDLRLRPIKDPILWPYRPPIVVIFAPPIRIRDLVAAQRTELSQQK
ncbi:MAG TPA: hypothetical protein VGR02_14395 [Thermoanaerobaculia bacterium]|jgi:hypothetical protein|nr:hypothetical protein [Thermoanaerobaculia bacterium]